MDEFLDKCTNSSNISDILFFVYVKNSPIILENVGDSWKKWGEKPIPRSRSDSESVTANCSAITLELITVMHKLLFAFSRYFKS